MKKILVLTSGGDSSGMNAYIKALAKLCKKEEIDLWASIGGYRGLIKDELKQLDYDDLAQIEDLGGSVIKSSRCPEFMTADGFEKALQTIKKSKANCVVVVGGNGSYMGAKKLTDAGINVLAIPGTIDNDLSYTDITLGYNTACQNAVEMITKIKQTMSAFDRGFVAEVMGRKCSDIALQTTIITNADLCITSKQNFDKILRETQKIVDSGIQSPLIVVQEGLLDIDALAKFLQDGTQKEFRAVKLGYIQRGGEPSNVDKLFAVELACATIKKFRENIFGFAIGKKDGVMVAKKLGEVTKIQKLCSKELLDIYRQFTK